MQRFRYFLLFVLLAVIPVGCGPAPSPEATATVSVAARTDTPATTPVMTSTATPDAEGDGLEERAKALVDLLVRGEYEQVAEGFDANMREALPPDRLRDEVWPAFVAQVGDYQDILGTRTDTVDEYRRVFVTTAFSRATLDVLVVFDSEGQVAGLFFVPAEATPTAGHYTPPDYARFEDLIEREVTVGQGQWALPGTLTLPQGTPPFPGLVLVHGSGPNDRDETVGLYKPFRDLAWGLASQGIAVLRYEKRTREYPEIAASVEELTVQEETIDDALAAVSLLRETEEIDAERIYLLGHSLGGMLVPRIGAQDADIAGFVILAGAARPLEDLFLDQTRYILQMDGEVTSQEQAALDEIEEQVARVKDPGLSPSTPASELPLGVPAGYWLDLRGYAPAEAAQELDAPLLILQGGRDYQVTLADFDLWKAALSGRNDVSFGYYPDLNHLFVAGEGMGSPEEYHAEPGNVAAQVVQDIAGWIQSQ